MALTSDLYLSEIVHNDQERRIEEHVDKPNYKEKPLSLTSKYYLSDLFPKNHVPLSITEDDYMAPREDSLIKPFSLLGPDITLDEIRKQIPQQTELVDAYPCTALQEGILALSMKQGGSFTPH